MNLPRKPLTNPSSSTMSDKPNPTIRINLSIVQQMSLSGLQTPKVANRTITPDHRSPVSTAIPPTPRASSQIQSNLTILSISKFHMQTPIFPISEHQVNTQIPDLNIHTKNSRKCNLNSLQYRPRIKPLKTSIMLKKIIQFATCLERRNKRSTRRQV